LQPAKKKKSSPKEQKTLGVRFSNRLIFYYKKGNFLKFCENFGVETTQVKKLSKNTLLTTQKVKDSKKGPKREEKCWRKQILCVCYVVETKKPKKHAKRKKVNSFFEVKFIF